MTVTAQVFDNLRAYIRSHLIGQTDLIDAMLVCLISDGHLLVEGMPGLAKTTAVKSLAEGIESDFHRVQFTPDLLPSDLIGSDIYRQEKGEFVFRQGPLFHNILLADEVNRAPAKVQSALLEAMGEKQITVGQTCHRLPELFMVLATQNPIEQEGTYHLPEAQLDRFLMHVWVNYPTRQEELQIIKLDSESRKQSHKPPHKRVTQAEIFSARAAAAEIFISEELQQYIVDIVLATRHPKAYHEDLAQWCRFGASPRASIALARCARAKAWLEGETFVKPAHIQKMAPHVLRHRILLSFQAEADRISTQDVIQRLLEVVAVP